MKNLLMISLFLTIGIGFFISQGFAEENNKAWESEFVQALLKGKEMIETGGNELADVPYQETILAEAVKRAIVIKDTQACQALKIAVDLEYNPYFVIKNIFSHGDEIDLDQLCMCAIEDGINKQIFAKASKDAVSPLGEPVFSSNELAQCQCLKEVGLGYHEPVAERPKIVKPPRKRHRFSPSNPT